LSISFNKEITAKAIGSISIVVAVLLIHAPRNHVTTINAATIYFGLVPNIFQYCNANLW